MNAPTTQTTPKTNETYVHPVTGEISPPLAGKLAAALAKAQAKMTHASKDRTNPHFGQKYATLASVVEALREPLSENGLAYTQSVETGPDFASVIVITTLMHLSGECISSTLRMPVVQKTPQGMGSAITYARRYSLAAIVGIAPDDDDDGNAASSHQNGPAAQQRRAPPDGKKPPPAAAPKPTTEEARKAAGAITTGDMAKVPPAPVKDESRVDPVEYMKVKIDTAQNEAELKALVEEITNLPDAAKDAVRPLWAARLEVMKKGAAK